MPSLYHIQTTLGTVEVMAATLQQAILSGLELTGPKARLVRCVKEGEW